MLDKETRVLPDKLIAWMVENEITITFLTTQLAEVLLLTFTIDLHTHTWCLRRLSWNKRNIPTICSCVCCSQGVTSFIGMCSTIQPMVPQRSTTQHNTVPALHPGTLQ